LTNASVVGIIKKLFTIVVHQKKQAMKKILKVLLILVLVIAVVIGAGASFISIRGIPKYDVNVPTIPNVEVTPERVARGEKIASMLCRNCHYNTETGKLTGRQLEDAPAFGKIYSKNITQDKEIGIGNWTDAQLIYFIRTGIHPMTGQYVPPYMVKLSHISDEDMRSIIAYLRSDLAEVQPSKVELPDTEPSFLTKFLSTIAFKPFPYPEKEIPNPDTSNTGEWGKYLALYQLECYTCHSRDFAKVDFYTPEKSLGFFGGGNEQLRTPDGQKQILSLNITPDEETGIGRWTEEQFSNAVRNGIVPNGAALRLPMQPYVRLTDGEIHALYSYLRTVPRINHKVDRSM
jgi:mono/diheme cytochrome c family protein